MGRLSAFFDPVSHSAEAKDASELPRADRPQRGRQVDTIDYRLMLKDVPVDGFWSISVYNAKGFFEKNALNAYSLNNLTAKPDAGGSYTIQFGGCRKDTPNCLPIVKGWNYTMRLYRPRKEILDGSWKLPQAQPVS